MRAQLSGGRPITRTFFGQTGLAEYPGGMSTQRFDILAPPRDAQISKKKNDNARAALYLWSGLSRVRAVLQPAI